MAPTFADSLARIAKDQPTPGDVHVPTATGISAKTKRRGFAALLGAVQKDYDPSEARDDQGQWTDGGGSSSSETIDPSSGKLHAAASEIVSSAPSSGAVYRPVDEASVAMAKKFFPTGFDVSDNAPNTYEDLVKHYHETGRMTVWSGGSDKTIFGDEKSNYAFRAWHDLCHLRGGHNFTPEGERGALAEMVKDVRGAYDHSARLRPGLSQRPEGRGACHVQGRRLE